ncbi:MAG: hypothetical protein GXY68_03415 [Chloroflexi bacterium]|jgi:phage replication-related protein YjqB (UPF0714/DUF867 family)|nr:hypothetical protein [Chloroflexota bacterium]
MSWQLGSFSDLVLRAQQGEDYDVVARERHAVVTVLALHGGHIEPLTGQLAEAIAGESWNLYTVRGLRADRAATLRLPTLRLTEVRCDALLAHSTLALAITGHREGQTTLVGGSNEPLTLALLAELSGLGLQVAAAPRLEAERLPQQCYNRTGAGGAQLSLPLALRQRLVLDDLRALAPDDQPAWSAEGTAFIAAVQRAVEQRLLALRSDLSATLAHFERVTREVHARGILSDHRQHRIESSDT